MGDRATQAEVIEAHGDLKRSGVEWKGSCPLCGGQDRFYVRKDGSFYCRQCLPDGKDVTKLGAMLDSLGLDVRTKRPMPPPSWVSQDFEMEAKAEAEEPSRLDIEITESFIGREVGGGLSEYEEWMLNVLRTVEEVEAGDRNGALDVLREFIPEVEEGLESVEQGDEDGDARFIIALKKSPRTMQGELLKRAKLAADNPLRPVPLASFKDVPRAPRVIWRNGHYGALLSEGEVAILSGAGGVGKSYFSLALAWAASSFQDDVLGFGVRPGKVVITSYEDRAPKVAYRAGMIAGRRTLADVPGDLPDALMVVPQPPPLWESTDVRQTGPSREWGDYWSMIGEIKPSFVIIDPLLSATPGLELNDAAGSRAFVQAVAHEAEEIGTAVLMVAHSNKTARGNPMEAGAGAISGSGQLFDACRGALFAFNHGKGMMVTCIKANDGPKDWGVLMGPDMRGAEGKIFAGWLRRESLSRRGVIEKLKERS